MDVPTARPLPASEHLRHNLATLRGLRGLSQAGLEEATAELGHRLDSTVIAKIERGARRVTVDDLMTLAAALDVTPLQLLLPRGRQAGQAPGLVIADRHALDARRAWAWAEQQEPWWEYDDRAVEQDPDGARRKAWHFTRLDDGNLAEFRRAADASGGAPGVVEELRRHREGDLGQVLDELRRLRRDLAQERLRVAAAALEAAGTAARSSGEDVQ